MFVSRNRKNRTYFVGQRGENMKVYYSVSFPRAKRRSQLTIKVDGKRLDLSGHQVRTLKSILSRGEELRSE
jgi:hypothetical protein